MNAPPVVLLPALARMAAALIVSTSSLTKPRIRLTKIYSRQQNRSNLCHQVAQDSRLTTHESMTQTVLYELNHGCSIMVGIPLKLSRTPDTAHVLVTTYPQNLAPT